MDTTFYPRGSLKRHGISMLVVVNYLMAQAHRYFQNWGHLFFHLTIFNRQVGFVELSVEEQASDGRLRFRVIGENNSQTFFETHFRIHNRWLARDRRRCSVKLLWMIKTAVAVQDGLDGADVISVIWGNSPARRDERKPFDLTHLPSDEEIAKEAARRQKFHDFMDRWLPPKSSGKLTSMDDTARDIIIR